MYVTLFLLIKCTEILAILPTDVRSVCNCLKLATASSAKLAENLDKAQLLTSSAL